VLFVLSAPAAPGADEPPVRRIAFGSCLGQDGVQPIWQLVWKENKADRVEGGRYLPNTDPEATILGAKQWAWFEEQLRVPAQVRIIGSSIQVVDEDVRGEKWANFPMSASGSSPCSGAPRARSSSAATATSPSSR
jgi:hypothetical protein